MPEDLPPPPPSEDNGPIPSSPRQENENIELVDGTRGTESSHNAVKNPGTLNPKTYAKERAPMKFFALANYVTLKMAPSLALPPMGKIQEASNFADMAWVAGAATEAAGIYMFTSGSEPYHAAATYALGKAITMSAEISGTARRRKRQESGVAKSSLEMENPLFRTAHRTITAAQKVLLPSVVTSGRVESDLAKNIIQITAPIELAAAGSALLSPYQGASAGVYAGARGVSLFVEYADQKLPGVKRWAKEKAARAKQRIKSGVNSARDKLSNIQDSEGFKRFDEFNNRNFERAGEMGDEIAERTQEISTNLTTKAKEKVRNLFYRMRRGGQKDQGEQGDQGGVEIDE